METHGHYGEKTTVCVDLGIANNFDAETYIVPCLEKWLK